jgi:V/A-type H+-transporting ATPase subunit B
MRLSEQSYQTISSMAGPLLFVEKVFNAQIGEMVRILTPEGGDMEGEVLEIAGDTVLIQVYRETQGLDIEHTSVVFTDSIKKVGLSPEIRGRLFDGSFLPLDGDPHYIPEKWVPVSGFPMNPAARARPEEFIETGISVIDGLNTLVKGQKLPLFSCAGLPAKEVIAQILKQARTISSKNTGDNDSSKKNGFVIVFAALGIALQEFSFYMRVLEEVGAGFVAFINRADETVMERLLTPRFALTTAEYLAFEQGMDVLVVITDMTNYCDALREISTARKELPGRRGYPGYMYSDLASLYERAGRIRGKPGSVTMLPLVTMPEDDITHPIPDLTGYITEGQIVLSRRLHQKEIFPPVDVLPSLSRLMQRGIGEGHTRKDHRAVSSLLYKYYAMGNELRRLESIVGREGMAEKDRLMLDFADSFEREFVHQGMKRRDISDTLDTGLGLIQRFGLEET